MTVQLSKKTIADFVPVRYLPEETAKLAYRFDRTVGAYINILYRYGIAAYPNVKPQLFFDYCERISLQVHANKEKNAIWLDTLEESIKKVIN